MSQNHILLVEDEALVAMLVEDALTDAGYTVDVFGTLSEALTLMRPASSYAAAVIDLNLQMHRATPIIDVLRQQVSDFPICIQTGVGLRPNEAQYHPLRNNAPTALLLKPYDPDDLIRIIGDLVSGTYVYPSEPPQGMPWRTLWKQLWGFRSQA